MPRPPVLSGEIPEDGVIGLLREIEALRKLGREVVTCSIRRTGPEHHRGPAEQDAARTTFYVLDAAKNPATLLRAKLAALATPPRAAGEDHQWPPSVPR